MNCRTTLPCPMGLRYFAPETIGLYRYDAQTKMDYLGAEVADEEFAVLKWFKQRALPTLYLHSAG